MHAWVPGKQQCGVAWTTVRMIPAHPAQWPRATGIRSGDPSATVWTEHSRRVRISASIHACVAGQTGPCMQVYFRQDAAATDSRYYAAQQKIPFGVDANRLSESMLGNLLK